MSNESFSTLRNNLCNVTFVRCKHLYIWRV